ncbi:hypothetical protein [Streptomyces sp. NPDC001680]
MHSSMCANTASTEASPRGNDFRTSCTAGGNPLGDALVAGGLTQLPQADRAEVRGQHGETLTGEVQRVAAVPGAQLQHLAGTGGPEDRGGMDGRLGRPPRRT